ncbi:protein zer-1 homolog [Lutzomyia longipalpis]|uniref:protein zer-1 homolog n=1 Tax=Lutzomyia longipalpis TaxID=7200 RepID=UPI00248393A8|nr:protein zer-1 homolog [Lutzomyia longipalpis]XP_055687595.1 protein zer-1 homolog [Lutzomyia longipalpis]
MSGRVRLKENNILDEDLPSLLEIVFKFLSENLSVVCDENKFDHNLELNEGVYIPNEICDRLLKYYQDCNQDINNHFIYIFRDTTRTPLKYVSLRNSTITDEGMEILLRHNLVSLSMWYCDSVTTNSWRTLIEHSSQLKSLELGKYVDMLKFSEPNEKTPIDFQLNLPHLRRLTLNAVVLQPSLQFSHLKELSYLDLTSCIFAEFSLEALVSLPNLSTLILFNVWPLEKEFRTLCKFKKLHTLDISVSNPTGYGIYKDPNIVLANLVENLPLLTHLDISGTNLAGTGVAQFEAKEKVKSSDIPGLVSRASRPLQFLGLYNTAHSACRRHDIPAITISGEANEEQILTSAVVYQDRPNLLTKVLNDLYHLLRFETCRSIHRALDVVLNAMDRHLRVKHMQISGSATLFYIVKGRDKSKFGTPLKNHIIRTLLNGMSAHLSDDTMMRNGCLTLCQFTIPNDVLFEYERLVRILLHGVSDTEQEGFVQRIAIYLLNSLACQVDGRQKLFLGDLGAISTMLSLINDRLTRNVFDDVMEVAWSTMWNVTDETAINCKRFLDGNGMEYFLGCLRCFPEKDELLRNMMGLLGNVAEVNVLRHRLMTSEFITVFANLLDSSSDGIEVSYNAAGVLAHIASDGAEAWSIETPSRREVLSRMVNAIERWDLHTERNINYRSFEPIFGLVRCYDIPECQHWAIWALANLTKVYPAKYCRLVEAEHGIELLYELITHRKPYTRIKELARMVLDHCAQNNQMTLDG